VVRAGQRARWRPGSPTYHADAHAAGHAWLRIYLMNPRDSSLLEPFKRRFEQILAKPIPDTLSFITDPEPGVDRTDRWTWADALYMAPPTLARLTQATGDARYMKFADQEFKATYDALYDPKEKLFYRDARFIDQRTPNGQKVFWSRGNGWVYAGLALLLDALPEDYPNRKFYVDLFRNMSPAVLRVQQPDGLWYPSLKDPKQVPIGETSGSALFLYGMAWGVRQGLIDRDRYWRDNGQRWRDGDGRWHEGRTEGRRSDWRDNSPTTRGNNADIRNNSGTPLWSQGDTYRGTGPNYDPSKDHGQYSPG